MEVKKVAEKWEIWAEKEEAAKSEKEVRNRDRNTYNCLTFYKNL